MLLKSNETDGGKKVLKGERKEKKRERKREKKKERKRKREIEKRTKSLIMHQQFKLIVI